MIFFFSFFFFSLLLLVWLLSIGTGASACRFLDGTTARSNDADRRRLCKVINATAAATGHWCYSRTSEKAGFDGCPLTEASLSEIRALLDHKRQYSSGTMKTAYFFPADRCALPHVETSITAILQHTQSYHLHFIGDSLSLQQGVGLRCELEQISASLYSKVQITLRGDPTLRKGLLCHTECKQASDFLTYEAARFPSKCADCLNGREDREYIERRKMGAGAGGFWVDEVPADVDALVFNSGSWYTPSWGFADDAHAMAEYKRTLELLVADLQPFLSPSPKKKKRVMVMFVLLPIDPRPQAAFWSRDYFPLKNSLARAILEPAGVFVIDAVNVSLARLSHDPNITIDYLHWRSPSATSVVSLISRLMLSIIAANL